MAYEQKIQDNNTNLQNSINIIKTFPDKQETIDQNLLNTQKNLIYQIAMALQNKSEAPALEAIPVTGIVPDGWYVFYEDENGILQTYGMDEISLLGSESRDDESNGYIEITVRKNSIMALFSEEMMIMGAPSGLSAININDYTGAELLYYDYGQSSEPGFAIFKIIEDNFNLFQNGYIEEECCFAPGTQILISLNGDTKNIEDVKENDPIVSYNILTGENYIAKVKKLIIKKDTTDIAEVFLANGTMLKMNAYHPLYTENGWHSITNHDGYDTLVIGDKVKTFNSYEEIIDIKRYKTDPIVTYNIDVINIGENIDDDSNDSFYANGVVAHNVEICVH